MHIHFIGIGGIGTSALAKYYLSQGHAVSGSDLASSEITEELERMGTRIAIGPHRKKNLPVDAVHVVTTAAVKKINPEVKEAIRRGVLIQSYPEALGDLTRRYKTITISGAHGKSTTTALAALALEEGYCDPTVIVGTKLREFGNSNFRRGYGPHLVLEADEWNRSFLNYSPHVAVVTNIDEEHLDTYKTVEGVEKTFGEYLSKVPPDGKIVANADDPRLGRVAKQFGSRVVWYSLKDPEAAIVRRVLKIPGEHNVSNGLAVLKLGRTLGIAEHSTLLALSRYRGSWRRFEWQGMSQGAHIIADYGHHPAEIHATLQAARQKFPYRRIWCVYQPHQHQRLAYLWDGFVGAFDLADRVCLLPVYDVAGRETLYARQKVSSVKLTHALLDRGKNAWHSNSFEAAADYVRSHVRSGDVVLLMGAGDIYPALSRQLLTSE